MKRKGFTLVEMLAVIAILGILVLIVLPNVLKNYRDAKKIAFIDEAKAVYTQATDKYVTERTKGNKIGLIEKVGENSGTNLLDISNGDDLTYTIRLDNNGQVTAFKLSNGELCIVGVGDFLGDYAKEDVLDLSEEEAQEKCAVTALNDNQKFILRLQNKTTIKTDYDPKMIYLKYNDGWYSDNNMHRKITNVTIPYKENNYYKGAWATNTIGSEIQAIACDGSIVQGPDGGGIFTGREEKPYVEAISRFEKKYYQVVFSGGESGSLTMEPCYYGASECHLPSNKDSNGYGKDIKKTGYLFTGWKDTKTNKIYADGASLPILTDANENEEAYKTYKFDNTKVCSNGEDEGDTNKINFEAQWTPIKYKIAYDCNEGTGTMANTDHTYDAEANLRTNTCKRSGYSFLGWSKTKTGSKDFDDNAKVKNLTTVNNSTVTLYAVWNACSAGTYLAGNTCTECAKDYYSAGTANASCTKCPTGYTTTGKGSSTKSACTINCAANKRVASVDAQCTTSCEAGYSHAAHTIKAGETSSVCTANTFTVAYNGNNSTSGKTDSHQCTYDQDCKLAANGFIRSGYSFAGWKKSNSGNTLDVGASIKNTVASGTATYYAQWSGCGKGSYSDGAVCKKCGKGYYSTGSANSSCTKCPDGYTTSGEGANTKSACTISCGNNTYVASADAKCTNCASGYIHASHSVAAGSKSAACSACGKGYYADSGACKKCAKGYYSEGSANASCTKCPDGYTTSGEGANTKSACTISCGNNTYVASADAKCTNCSSGYIHASHSVAAGSKSSACSACGKGYYADSGACKKCAKGYYSEGSANASCTKCPDGYTTSGEGANTKTACTISCGANTRVASANAKCTNCSSGYIHASHSVSLGSTSSECSACGKGYYADSSGACKKCAKGYYSTGSANSSCTKCPDGYTTDGEGANAKSACKITCSANTTVASADAKCTACPSGKGNSGGTITAGNTGPACANNCPSGCSDCTDGVCTKCPNGKGLINGKCVDITSSYEGTLVSMFDYEATEAVGLWQYYKVEKNNAGDAGGLPIPTSKVNVCIKGYDCPYANTTPICWVLSGTRTVCNYKAATEICGYYSGYDVLKYTRMHSFNYLGGASAAYDGFFDYAIAPFDGTRTYGLDLCTPDGGSLSTCAATTGCDKSNNGNCYPPYLWYYNTSKKPSISLPSLYGHDGNPVMILAGPQDEKIAASVRCSKR